MPNLNDQVRVKLTEAGERWLVEYFAPLKVPVELLPKADPQGFTTWQLWDLMNVFGPTLHMGIDPGRMPFEGNQIHFIRCCERTADVHGRDCTLSLGNTPAPRAHECGGAPRGLSSELRSELAANVGGVAP